MELVVDRVNQTGSGFLSEDKWYNVNRYATPMPTLDGIKEGMTVEVDLNKGGFINKIVVKGGQPAASPQQSPKAAVVTGSTYASKSGRGQQTGNVISNAVTLTVALIGKGLIKSVEAARGSVAESATFLNSVADRLNGVPVEGPEEKPQETKKEETPL